MKHQEPSHCEVIASARMRGDQQERVQGMTAVASRSGEAHIALRVGQVLLYLEDREALTTLVRAVRKASELADTVFGPEGDAFDLTEIRARRAFEKGRRSTP